VWQHKNDVASGFTRKYGVHRLAYYEVHADMTEAIGREKRLKKWERAWTIELIERNNPGGAICGRRSLPDRGLGLDSRVRGNDSTGRNVSIGTFRGEA